MKIKRDFSVYAFLLPGILGFLVFFIFPFFISLGYSFLSSPVNGKFVGLKNFVELLGNPAYQLGLKNTLVFIGISVPINMGLALGVAVIINRLSGKKDLFTLIFLIPLVIPSGSMVFFWKSLFEKNGVINGILNSFGLEKINWLDSNLALFVIVIIFIWKNFGYNMVLYLTALKNISPDFYEAAAIDGATHLQRFYHITLPNLIPTNILVFTMSIVSSFKVFKEIYLITGAYPHSSIYTLQHFMNNMFSGLNYPKLTTATTLLVVMVSVVTQGLLKMERKRS